MPDLSTVLDRLDAGRAAATDLLADLVRIPSENPPGDTRALAAFVRDWLAARGHAARVVAARDDLPNLVCTVRGARPGPALVLNGHLDTYPAGDRAAWSVDPFGGVVRDGKLYGRGVGDMKAGVAAHLLTFVTLADVAAELAGRLTLTLVSDEENGGALGAGHLLAVEPEARGDACLIGDAGAADLICFAEKGAVWADLVATGRGAHSAHVHRGRNAVHALVAALGDVVALDGLDVGVPDAVRAEVERGRAATDAAFGEGATDVLGRVTVTVGLVAGGQKRNLVPDAARAEVDVRIPAGGSTGAVVGALEAIARRHGVEVVIRSANEPHWSPPDAAIFGALGRATERVRGRPAPLAGRIGASDARYFRRAGIPTAVYGPAVANMGGPDEHVDLDEWWDVVRVHVVAALDLLGWGAGR
ncbi:MAG TPA: M20/M25/M40 family metallo-hydrolase [Thermodesulfobacteriota bacterium]